MAPGCATEQDGSPTECKQICAEKERLCYQEVCAMVNDPDSLCARRCRERHQACEAECAKPSD